jgi:hypothetical protein
LFSSGTAPLDEMKTCRTTAYPFCNVSDINQFTKYISLTIDGVSWLYINTLRKNLRAHSHEFITYTQKMR